MRNVSVPKIPYMKIAQALAFIALRFVGVSWGNAFYLLYKESLKGTTEVNGFRQKIWAAVGFVPDEGEVLIGNMLFMRVLTDRDTALELGLFTNVAPGETITEATLTEPTGTGYARIAIVDANWTATGSVFTYPSQVFTGGAGGWTGSVQGYFMATNAAGGTKRILGIEVDANGPYTIAENDTYTIDMQNTPA